MTSRHLCKRRVRLHEHGCIEGHFEQLAKLFHTLLFGLAATIGKEDERDTVSLEIGEGAMSAGERLRGAEEDAVNAASM